MIDKIISEDIQQVGKDSRMDAFKDVHVMVTGGAGFLGSYLCDVLVRLGADVKCLDNFSTGLEKNIDHLFGQKNFALFKEDVSNFEGGETYDYILHLASRASPEDYQSYPIETLRTNSFGTLKMLELAKKNDSTMLFASTSEVYGDATFIPTPETYWGVVNPIGVRSCYDEGKRFGEALVMAYHREYCLDTRIVRIYNTFGPRLRADGYYARALSRFIEQAMKGEDITVYGDGTQTRAFCYVTDTVTGILLTLLSKRSRGDVINIGNQQEITILELAKRILKVVGSKSKITFKPLPKDDPKRRCPDTTKAKLSLNWTPKTSFDVGLARTVEWFRQHHWP